MATITKTQMVWNRTAFNKNMKALSDAFIRGQREEMQKIATIWADGYNSIVENWENAPRFRTHVAYYKSTRRFYVRVQIIGDQDAVNHFDWVDNGLRRSKKANSKGDLIPNKLKIEVQSKKPPPINLPSRNDYVERFGTDRGFMKWQGEEYKRLREEAKKAAGQPSRRGFMPMRLYKARTGKGGYIGGPGTYIPSGDGGDQWKAIPYLSEVTLGDIQARYFTAGLYSLMAGRGDFFGVGSIWPRTRTFESRVASGYRRGIQYYEQSKQG